MAFSTQSTITSIDSFLTDLMAFAVANAGFTDHGTDATGTEIIYRISKTVDTVQTWYGFRNANLSSNRHSDSRVEGRMKLALPTDANFETVASGQRFSTFMGTFDIAPNFVGYSFFTDGVSVFAALELTSGVFAHMAFGNITKAGVWTGGAYLMGNHFSTGFGTEVYRDLVSVNEYSSTMVFGARSLKEKLTDTGGCYIRFDIGGADDSDFTMLGTKDDSFDGAQVAASGTMPPNGAVTQFETNVGTFYVGMHQRILKAAPSEATFISPLFPVYMFRQTSDYANAVPLGHVPNVASINLTQLSDKDLVNTDWRVFPLSSQIDDDGVSSFSDFYGIAYKEIV